MPRIYRDVKPPQNKAIEPVKETKKAPAKEKPVVEKTGKKENGGE